MLIIMFNFLQTNKEILNNSTRCKDVFKNTAFMNSKRQNQTLKSILVEHLFKIQNYISPLYPNAGKVAVVVTTF